MSTVSEKLKAAEFEGILNCVHCGLCLDACPTYTELATEQDSPRGRLFLMRGLWEGELELTEEVAEPLWRCLDCRACETACPSNVPYGELLEKTRDLMVDELPMGIKEKFLRTVFFKCIFPYSSRLTLLGNIFWLYQKLRIPQLVTGTFIKYLLPKSTVEQHKLMPKFNGGSFKKKNSGKHLSAKEAKLRVGLFTGCIMDLANQEIHQATLKVLLAAGCEVELNQDQGCCGALHVHSGERDIAQALAKKNISAFGDGLDFIITNAAGCGAQLQEYKHLFKKEDILQERIERFENKVVDILQFLEIHKQQLDSLSFKNNEQEVILYDAPCHLIHAQKVDAKPIALLNGIPGIELVAIPEADRCCGSAGIYNLSQPKLSNDILDRKLDNIELAMKQNPKAKVLVTGNPGCLYQLKYGIEKRQLDLQVVHPITVIASSLVNNK
ncbi:MAG: (Fe-S)-binding protein [Lentisphaeria bacterium]|nr:(Fe-S)-binding protein [Lentisphaeria bacterium]NQZ71081.1 (Fe-S)-binding protein [Lentisphaeria bacterium]